MERNFQSHFENYFFVKIRFFVQCLWHFREIFTRELLFIFEGWTMQQISVFASVAETDN